MYANTALSVGTRPSATTDLALYKDIASHWPSGVAVITAVGCDGKLHGLTMSAVITLSLVPMQFLISVDRRSVTLPVIKDLGRFCINFLTSSQEGIAMQLASKSGDKLNSVRHRISQWGLPIIDGALASITCDVHSILPGGDHEIIIGDVLDMEHAGGEPLVYFKRSFHSVSAI
ncbi:flavin reductase family protein [Corticibacterium sp. UT-5YL-CI-8]|nr:flavin reductase family protein [Tianweitania sp. UT-5YL-CI-8]